MKTELLDIYEIAKKIASIANGETKECLAIKIVMLTRMLHTEKPIYVIYNKNEKLVDITLSRIDVLYEFTQEYELIWKIEKSKELNKYKITYV